MPSRIAWVRRVVGSALVRVGVALLPARIEDDDDRVPVGVPTVTLGPDALLMQTEGTARTRDRATERAKAREVEPPLRGSARARLARKGMR